MSFIAQCSYSGAQNAEINVIGQQTIWQPFSAAIISQNESGLEILVVTNHTHKLWNGAYLLIRISSSIANSIHFTLGYWSKSYLGNVTFLAQVRDNSSNVLWNGLFNNTSSQLINNPLLFLEHLKQASAI
jgi:protein-S-isoprenylcysteine O-methyltransferase Ste14